VRWRIVHVLGSSDHAEAAAFLSEVIRNADDHEWVVYGTVRSLAEIASRTDDLDKARQLLAPIIESLPKFTASVRRETCEVALRANGAQQWRNRAYLEVLDAGWKLLGGRSGAEDEAVKWKDMIETVNKLYTEGVVA
jgi:hypothetical protein